MSCYVDINLWSFLQDTLLLKSAKEGDLEGVRDSLIKQANINIADEVYTILMYLFTLNFQKFSKLDSCIVILCLVSIVIVTKILMKLMNLTIYDQWSYLSQLYAILENVHFRFETLHKYVLI